MQKPSFITLALAIMAPLASTGADLGPHPFIMKDNVVMCDSAQNAKAEFGYRKDHTKLTVDQAVKAFNAHNRRQSCKLLPEMLAIGEQSAATEVFVYGGILYGMHHLEIATWNPQNESSDKPAARDLPNAFSGYAILRELGGPAI